MWSGVRQQLSLTLSAPIATTTVFSLCYGHRTALVGLHSYLKLIPSGDISADSNSWLLRHPIWTRYTSIFLVTLMMLCLFQKEWKQTGSEFLDKWVYRYSTIWYNYRNRACNTADSTLAKTKVFNLFFNIALFYWHFQCAHGKIMGFFMGELLQKERVVSQLKKKAHKI